MPQTLRSVRAQVDQQASSTKFLRGVSTLLGVLTSAAAMVLLAGCGGGPDVEGYWEGVVSVPDEEDGQFNLQLERGDADDLRGTITLISDDEDAEGPLSGEIDSDGAFRIELGPAGTMDGQIDGDDMAGQWLSEGEGYPFEAERISESEAQAQREEREATRREQARREDEAAERQQELQNRYQEIANEVGEQARDVQNRMSVLFDAAGQGPGEQLSDMLGPEAGEIEEDLYACSLGGVSCEVGQLEARLESDAEDLAEGSCETADMDYYAEYSFEDQSSDYLERSNDIEAAAENLAEAANEMEANGREMGLAGEELEQAGGNASSSWSPDDIATLAEDAREADRQAEQALVAAGERYAEYESRAARVIEEGLALRDEAEC